MTTIKRLFVTYPSLRKRWKEVEESAILVFFWPPLAVVLLVLLVMIIFKMFE